MNRQKGSVLIIYGIVIAGVLTGFILYGQYKYYEGVADEKAANKEAIEKHERALAKLKDEHRDELVKVEDQLERQKQSMDKAIRDRISAEKKLFDWWNTPVDPTAVDYAWVRNQSGNSEMLNR